jgi:hypothetical protein
MASATMTEAALRALIGRAFLSLSIKGPDIDLSTRISCTVIAPIDTAPAAIATDAAAVFIVNPIVRTKGNAK